MKYGMIVDDSEIMRIRLREILEPICTIKAEASDGLSAIPLYKQFLPDFVTLDISMPQMNDLEALQQILLINPAAKIVIVSAVGQKQIFFEALRLGATDFIVKPFEPERVIKAFTRLFE